MKSACFSMIITLTLTMCYATAGQADEPNQSLDPYTQGHLYIVGRQYQVLKGLLDHKPSEETRDYIGYAMRALYVTPGSEFDISFNDWKKQLAEGRAAIAAQRASHPELQPSSEIIP